MAHSCLALLLSGSHSHQRQMHQQVFQTSQRMTRRWTHVERELRRSFSSTPRHLILVGPPDPVSNIRPVIYDDAQGAAGQASRPRRARRKDVNEASASNSNPGPSSRDAKAATTTHTDKSPTHPYLLDEFSGDPSNYQWRAEQSRLDAYNHAFWKDVRTLSSSTHASQAHFDL